MEKLLIEATRFTPRVDFNPEKYFFEISGFSLPENVTDFYIPILNWLGNYYTVLNGNPEKLRFSFKLVYYNSGSFKMIINILQKITLFKQKNKSIEIVWYYDKEDYQLKEIGEELSELVGHPFIFKNDEDEA